MNKNLINLKRNLPSYLILFLTLFCSVILAVNTRYSTTVTQGIMLWSGYVLPSVFPYFFLTSIMSAMPLTTKLSLKLSPVMNKCFNQSGIIGYPFFMSVIAGYPLGAKLVSDLKLQNKISLTESVRASALCSTSSPMFLIGSVGGIMFNNTLFGVLLLACNFLSAITLGVIFSFYKKSEKPSSINLSLSTATSQQKNDDLIGESVYSAINSSLFVGGIITLFFVLTEMLISLKLLSPFTYIFSNVFGSKTFGQAVTFGIFEYTKGLKTLASAPISFFSLPIASAICGFGGISIIMQSVVFLKKAKIKVAPFIFSKFLGATLNFIFALIISLIPNLF